MRTDLDRLKDILEHIKKVQDNFDRTRYFNDELYRYGIIRCCEIIGEASKALSNQTKNLDSTIKWHLIIGFRNFIVHEYHAVDWDTVLETIEDDFPELLEKIKILHEEISHN